MGNECTDGSAGMAADAADLMSGIDWRFSRVVESSEEMSVELQGCSLLPVRVLSEPFPFSLGTLNSSSPPDRAGTMIMWTILITQGSCYGIR